MGIFAKKKQPEGLFYDYGDTLAREETVSRLFAGAASAKEDAVRYWRRMKAYYDGPHGNAAVSAVFEEKNGMPFCAAQAPDGYIHVESQIEPGLPEFEFSPRNAEDAAKAKQREKLVRYICDRNELDRKNAGNERRLGILGSAVWKVFWDETEGFDTYNEGGDVSVTAPDPAQIFPDPAASSVDECEYIGYSYRIHREKARRLFEKELKERGVDFSDVLEEEKGGGFSREDGSPFVYDGYDPDSETVRVTEWWFRQPVDGECDIPVRSKDGKTHRMHFVYRAGDIALTVLLGKYEVRYIPKYWKCTGCNMFPFVIYDRLPREGSLWGRSELEAIIPLIDAADRELAFAQYNSAFSSNDIIVAEEDALCEDSSLDNSPGAVWKLHTGKMGKVQRLGNGAYAEGYLHSNYDRWKNMMQEATGNFAVSQGNEPHAVTTATGIALLNERAKSRSSIKKIGKTAGFKRLYELCDRTALEFYDDGRVVFINDGEGDLVYRRADHQRKKTDGAEYFPCVDIRIHVGDGLANSKAFTVSCLASLLNTTITEDNYRIVKGYLELCDIPNRVEICDVLDKKYGGVGAASEGTALPTDVFGTEKTENGGAETEPVGDADIEAFRRELARLLVERIGTESGKDAYFEEAE